jgi:hypothetical protein
LWFKSRGAAGRNPMHVGNASARRSEFEVPQESGGGTAR